MTWDFNLKRLLKADRTSIVNYRVFKHADDKSEMLHPRLLSGAAHYKNLTKYCIFLILFVKILTNFFTL